ncbi:hypothetical protein [Fodinicola feengrottensis]|uniref:hypothetical protein n=1 Tax=Fodinicola feengrottensis TaxID=435914 RepID=UPI0031DA53F4
MSTSGERRSAPEINKNALDRRAKSSRERRRMAAVTAATAGGLISLTVALLGPNASTGAASTAAPSVQRPAPSSVTVAATTQRR